MLRTIATVMSGITFFLVYTVIPHRRVPWRHALIGAVIAAVLFETSKEAFAAYVRIAPTYNLVYGTAAFVPVFLVWVYTSWLVILLGAEITASAAYWRDALWKKTSTPVSQFRQAVLVVRALAAAGSEPARFESLRKATSIPAHELEDAVAHLTDAKIVRRVRGRGYVLARPARDITLAEVYGATLPAGGAMSEEGWEDISPALARSVHDMRERLQCPVTSSDAQPARPEPVRKGRRGKARSGRSSR
jgi:membrane protein